jgi:hypothetical protein
VLGGQTSEGGFEKMPEYKNPIVWITVANVIYLASYSVRAILWLRLLTVLAAALLIPYYAMQSVPLRAAIEWNAVFIAINCYWIVRLIIERRPVHFTADEEQLRRLSFPSLTPHDARDLFAMGAWDDLEPDTSIVVHDREKTRFSVILRGATDVIYRGEKISELGAGQFIGAIDLHADTLRDIDVLTRTATRVMCWPRSSLQTFLVQHPDVASALDRSLGFEMRHILNTALTKLIVPATADTP